MKVKEVVERLRNNSLNDANLKYCYVKYDNGTKIPMRYDGKFARTNVLSDFVTLDEIANSPVADRFDGLGISVQASNVCGVDIDHCVDVPFDKSTINDFAKSIISMFKDWAYVEFSFSGTGIRILFRAENIEDYETYYYIKNSTIHTEYYQCGNDGEKKSNRFLTVTGVSLYDNPIDGKSTHMNIIIMFLNMYMRRSVPLNKAANATPDVVDDRSISTLKNILFNWMIVDSTLSDLWFHPAPGSGKDESERDYHLCKWIYTNVTKDKDKIKDLFEMSEFYKSKDRKHMSKWKFNNNRYYEYIYRCLKEGR